MLRSGGGWGGGGLSDGHGGGGGGVLGESLKTINGDGVTWRTGAGTGGSEEEVHMDASCSKHKDESSAGSKYLSGSGCENT